MSLYDLEQLVRDLETLFKAQLNTEISIVNADKADFALPLIKENAWYMNHIPKVWNHSEWIVWGMSNAPETTDRQQDNRMREARIFFEVLIPDRGNNTEPNFYKILRYSRALEAVANKNFDKVGRGIVKLQVDQSVPVGFQVEGISKPIISGGIIVKANMSVA